MFWLSRSAIIMKVWNTQKEYKGREASVYSGMNFNNIIPKNAIIKFKLIHNYIIIIIKINPWFCIWSC